MRAFLVVCLILCCIGCNKDEAKTRTSVATAPNPSVGLEKTRSDVTSRSTAPRDDTGEAWKTYTAEEEGFSLLLPPNWQPFEADPNKLDKQFNEFVDKNPDLTAFGQNVRRLLVKTRKFFAYDEAAIRTTFATNLNISRADLPAKMTLDGLVESILDDLNGENSVSKPIDHSRVELQGLDSERFLYQRTFGDLLGKAEKRTLLQFLCVGESDYYILTFITPAGHESKYSALFDRISKSFRLTKKKSLD